MGEERAENIRPLYIPSKIQRKFQLIEGVGMEQIIKIFICTAIGLVIDRIITIFLLNMDITISILIIIVAGLIGFVFYRINEYNQSISSIIKVGMRFNKRQRRYKYVHYDRWRNRV